MIKPNRHISAEIPQEVRAALYYRLHWLWPILAHPAVRRGWRVLLWAGFVAWLLFVALLLALRYAILPQVADYRPQIEQAASRSVGQPVRIGHLEARWRGLNPDLLLEDVVVSTPDGAPAFTLAKVESVLSWRSLWRFRPILALLSFERPVLHVRRDAQGRITIAGLDTQSEGDPAFSQWLLEQRRIRIHDATIVWEDALRRAAPLALEDLQFSLDNSGRRHRFGLSAAPPAELAARIEMRGEVAGELGEALDSLAGKLFVELDYADLAGWQAWVDYPVHLPRGRGAVRVWADFDGGEGKLTTDLALEDVRVRLGRQLPELDLASLRGRFEGSYRNAAWGMTGRQVELRTSDGLRVTPTNFHADWRRDPKSAAVSGSANASLLDLAVLGRLADYLPLDEKSREILHTYRPEGKITELRASWNLVGETLQRYALKAGFTGLGIRDSGYVPGAAGLAGYIDCNEKGGDLRLDAQASRLSLPAVFPEPDMDFDRLNARANWKNAGKAIDIQLENLEFAGADAAGSARGKYRFTGDGPGEIDLIANVDRADGRAVWRYMPHAVNVDAREWLKRGIVGGRGYDGRLVLKGNLKDFPFRDGVGGTFLVTAKAADAKIDYADGWPVIEHIDADMRFGVGMKINASRGTILGAKLANVDVEIPDFESHEEMLLIKGLAQGPTSEFLRFIDQSPVAEKIDRFTDGMQASGNGKLNLELDIPLRHALDTRMRGVYHFQNNELQPVSGLPPLTQVNGQMALTENTITAQDISGRVFGGPLKVRVNSAGDQVAVQATGKAAIAEVSSHFGWPLINFLTGSTNWKADINIRHRNADVVVASDLTGISSPLPEPLNKTAGDVLPLRIERTAPEAGGEQYRITLGSVAQGLILRRGDAWERGVLSVGDGNLRLPEKGLAIRVAGAAIDADAWRNYLSDSASSGTGGDAGLALSVVSLRTPRLHLFGRDFNQVETTLRPRDGGWQIGLNTQEASGDVFWNSGGEGWVEGNFKRLQIRSASATGNPSVSLIINSLPGMNLTVDDFYIGEMALGKLELKARNDQGVWQLDRLNLKNPDGVLSGKGRWANIGHHKTQLDFELNSIDSGKLLARLGYADAVRRGAAKLQGKLQWNGPLTNIDYPSLTGQLTVNAEKGQFNKLEPGVGKLLGLISLQSLPRRLTLDFRDIFSDGLAFDSIEGNLAVQKGIMRTSEPLRIYGPAVQVEMTGETDLLNETQDLQVVVRPELGGLAAVGTAALINPVAGAAALVANTVLKKPLNRLFSYHYHVTGNWNDPQVDKAEQATEGKPAANSGDVP